MVCLAVVSGSNSIMEMKGKEGIGFKELVEAEVLENTSGGPSHLALGGEIWG